MSFFAELKRRNVFRVGITYVIGGWLLLQLTDVLSELLDLPDVVGRTIVMIVAIGLPLALFLAWAFELTPEGVKREKDVDRSQSITPQTGKKLNNTILVMMALAIGYLLYDKFSPEKESEPFSQGSTVQVTNDVNEKRALTPVPERQSIAVLPFENFSDNQSDQYFADGLADTLLHKLAQISDLKVIARNSSFQFKGTNRDIREIGRILGVKTVLEGSVQRAGDQVRIIAQLINTADGVHLWSQSFDDSMDNIFALQDRVAGEIVAQLQVNLSKEEQQRLVRNGTDNPQAYDLLMRAINAKHNWDEMVDVEDQNWEPLQLAQQVVELDPQYSVGWAYLSQLYNRLAFATDSADDYDRYVSRSRAAAEEALRLDPDLSLAHEAMGWVEHRERETTKAARYFRRVLELNPNSGSAMSGLGLQLARTDPEEALRLFTRAHEIDPQANVIYRQKHFALMGLGRVEEAIQQMELAVEAEPDSGLFYNDLSDLLIGRQGRPDEAARQLSRFLQLVPTSFDGTSGMVEAWIEATDDARASAWMDLLMMDRNDSDSAKLLNAGRLLSAGHFQEVLQQLDDVHENQQNAWRIVMLSLNANLGLKESAKAAEYAIQFRSILNEMKARGAASPVWDVFATVLELLSKEQSQADFDSKDSLGPLQDVGNIPFLQSAYYLMAGLKARMGNLDEAMAHLEQALEKPNGGVFNIDIFGFSVEQSPLLNPLRGNPTFEDWLLRYRERRDTMRQRMIEMESRGEIVKSATIRRITAQ